MEILFFKKILSSLEGAHFKTEVKKPICLFHAFIKVLSRTYR